MYLEIGLLSSLNRLSEVTGRKTRQVKRDLTKIGYKKRRISNIKGKNAFQSGDKLITVLLEGARTGFSLQADKRVSNQRRRCRMTLELSWLAEKAIQQLGLTHHSNQLVVPIYKFLISDVGGEARSASAVTSR